MVLKNALFCITLVMGCSSAGEEPVADVQQAAVNQGDEDCGSDPLLLDMGSGVAMSDLTHGVLFDADANGVKEQVAWPTAGGWLALDLNGNGKIDNGKELFGTASKTPGGLASLAAYDDDLNGIVDFRDAQFSHLVVWTDKNRNGVTDAGELRTMADLKIVGISVHSNEVAGYVDAASNNFLRASNVLRSDGLALLNLWSVFPVSTFGTHRHITNAQCPPPHREFLGWQCFASCYFRIGYIYNLAFGSLNFSLCGGYGYSNPVGDPLADSNPVGIFYGASDIYSTWETAAQAAYDRCEESPYQFFSRAVWDLQCEKCDRYGVWQSHGGTPVAIVNSCFKVYTP